MKKAIIYLSILFFYSCNLSSQENNKTKNNSLSMDIQKCVDSKVKNTTQDNIHLFKIYLEIESILLEEGFLESNSKVSYKKLFSKFESNSENPNYKKVHSDLKTIFKNRVKEISWLSTPSIFMANYTCSYAVMIKNNLEVTNNLYAYNKELDKFIKSGTWIDWKLNNKLLNSIPDEEFTNITFKASVISILYHYNVFKSNEN